MVQHGFRSILFFSAVVLHHRSSSLPSFVKKADCTTHDTTRTKSLLASEAVVQVLESATFLVADQAWGVIDPLLARYPKLNAVGYTPVGLMPGIIPLWPATGKCHCIAGRLVGLPTAREIHGISLANNLCVTPHAILLPLQHTIQPSAQK